MFTVQHIKLILDLKKTNIKYGQTQLIMLPQYILKTHNLKFTYLNYLITMAKNYYQVLY